VFVARVTRIVDPTPLSDSERDRIREDLERSKRNMLQNQWIVTLREEADIEDKRRSPLLQ